MSERETGQDKSLVPSPRQISRRHVFRLLTGGLVRPNPKLAELLLQMTPKVGTILQDIAQVQQTQSSQLESDPSLSGFSWEEYDEYMDHKFPDLEPKREDFELMKHLEETLGRFQTVDELVEFVGPLTPEEKAMLTDPHLYDDPTPEELAFIGDDVIERVQDRVRDRIKKNTH
jgi:hypothetical protein